MSQNKPKLGKYEVIANRFGTYAKGKEVIMYESTAQNAVRKKLVKHVSDVKHKVKTDKK